MFHVLPGRTRRDGPIVIRLVDKAYIFFLSNYIFPLEKSPFRKAVHFIVPNLN